MIFLGGGVFVWSVARLSFRTTRDVVRIAALERELTLDPLTGVFNRRFLNVKLEEEVFRARASGRSLSILIIDLDSFKCVNDTYGHMTGDLVLVHVGQVIASLSGADQTVIRYGGRSSLSSRRGPMEERSRLLPTAYARRSRTVLSPWATVAKSPSPRASGDRHSTRTRRSVISWSGPTVPSTMPRATAATGSACPPPETRRGQTAMILPASSAERSGLAR